MPNSIETISKHLPLLDRKYQMEAKTSILDVEPGLVRETMDAKSVLLPRMTLQGLADYERSGGYVTGDTTLVWETHTFSQDRGRMFNIDTMDDAETAFLLFANMAGEFIRLHVAPELDAYRLSKYANKSGLTGATGAITSENVIPSLVAGRTALVNAHVPLNDIYIFATPDVYGSLMLAKDIGKSIALEKRTVGGVDFEINTFNRMPIIEVPAERLMTAYTMRDGTTSGQEGGGFVAAGDAKQINFIMMARSAVMQIVKRAQPKIIQPGENQKADGWLFGYRIYHDAFVPENKKKAIYVHKAS